jgi:hypothetical protein
MILLSDFKMEIARFFLTTSVALLLMFLIFFQDFRMTVKSGNELGINCWKNLCSVDLFSDVFSILSQKRESWVKDVCL